MILCINRFAVALIQISSLLTFDLIRRIREPSEEGLRTSCYRAGSLADSSTDIDDEDLAFNRRGQERMTVLGKALHFDQPVSWPRFFRSSAN